MNRSKAFNKRHNLQIGDIRTSRVCGDYEILTINKSDDVSIRFVDNPEHTHVVRLSHAVNGDVNDPFKPMVAGHGYMGVGEYTSILEGRQQCKEYDIWSNMLKRCYTESGTTTVCKEWLNYQVFAKWYNGELNRVEEGYLVYNLIDTDATEYNPRTTTLIPTPIYMQLKRRTKYKSIHGLPTGVTHQVDRNNRPTGRYSANLGIKYKRIRLGTFYSVEDAARAYREAKEKHVRELAHEYKSKLTPCVFEALMRWTV